MPPNNKEKMLAYELYFARTRTGIGRAGGDGGVIGAGTLVTAEVASDTLIIRNAVRIVRSLA